MFILHFRFFSSFLSVNLNFFYFIKIFLFWIYKCVKKDRENIIDNKKQKIKDYQKEYRKNITNEQKQKYKRLSKTI